MTSIFGNLFRKPMQEEKNMLSQQSTFSQYDEEYIRYCIELEQTVSALEANLHSSDDPAEIAMQTLKVACDFYDGDWAGILEVDLDLDVWTSVKWYNPSNQDRTRRLMDEFGSTHAMPCWRSALRQGTPIIVADTALLKDELPEEHLVYERLNIKSIIATPFAPNPMGFLAIRNPKRYSTKPSMVSILAYVLHRAMAQQHTIDSAKMTLSPEAIQSDKDVIINFFGDMEICTSKGILREQDFKYPKSARVATYLMLHRKAAHPPLEIANTLWPNDQADPDSISSNIRGYVYRFRQAFSLISDYPLIESTPNGYRINPQLRIMTDIQKFDSLWESAQQVTGTAQKMDILKQAVALYRGPIFENASDERWLMGLSTYYSMRYAGVVNELLSMLAKAENYDDLQKYAATALGIIPGNIKAHYWRILAMYHLGAVEMVQTEIARIKLGLSAEEFDIFMKYIRESNDAEMLSLLDR